MRHLCCLSSRRSSWSWRSFDTWCSGRRSCSVIKLSFLPTHRLDAKMAWFKVLFSSSDRPHFPFASSTSGGIWWPSWCSETSPFAKVGPCHTPLLKWPRRFQGDQGYGSDPHNPRPILHSPEGPGSTSQVVSLCESRTSSEWLMWPTLLSQIHIEGQ